ncbi:hypothetical protein MKX03_027575 [Papaver bracteatum]|nr:hypothetical protein MKX03_027575 [Papaver bracteatum]
MMFKKWIDPMSHSVKIYDTCIGCTQCVRACPTDVLEMIPWDGCKAKQIASAPRTEDCVGCKRCESACPTDFLSVRVYLWHETTRSMGNKVIRWYTISICLLELLLTTYVFCYHFQLDDPLIQLEQDFKWINFFDFHWRLGIDGISIGPILLTGFITTLATLAARPVTRDSRLFHFLMLAMYSDTHGEAHYSTCMLLAGILLKMGAYGLVRINMELLPHAHSIFSPWLIIVGTGQIIYAALTSHGQRNLKKRIAYSSVSHMGFTIIGIASVTDMGLNGAILQIISHGFIGAALFFLAGTSYDRIRLVYLDEMGGIVIPMPKIFTMFSSFSMAYLALPGMSGFVAELVIFFGIITSPKYLLTPKILITFVMAIGMILTPIYSLSMSRQMFYGYKQFNAKNSYFFDSGPQELFVSICIFMPVIGIGIYPDFVLSLSVDKVEAILSNYFSR